MIGMYQKRCYTNSYCIHIQQAIVLPLYHQILLQRVPKKDAPRGVLSGARVAVKARKQLQTQTVQWVTRLLSQKAVIRLDYG